MWAARSQRLNKTDWTVGQLCISCQHKKLKSIRAVKILRKDALDEKEVERFIHEIEILKKLVKFINSNSIAN